MPCDASLPFVVQSVRSSVEFKTALQELDAQRLSTFLSQKQCDFSMNAHSSHAGDVWERQIKTVKSVLSSTQSLSQGRLSDGLVKDYTV